MTEREAGGSGSGGPLPLREIDGIVRRAGPVSLTIEDVVLLVLRADPRPVGGAGRLTGLVLRALTEAIGGRDTEPAVFEGAPGGPRSAAVERALDNLSFSNCVRVSGGGGAPSFEIAPRGRDRIGAKWDALSDGARSALSQARAGRGADAPDALKEGVYVHNKELLEGGARDAALSTGARGEGLAAKEPPALDGAGEARRQRHVDRGDRLFGEGRHDEAYKNFKLAAKMRAPDAGLHLKMARTMNKMKLYKGALRHCRAAIRADPAGAGCYAAAGRCLGSLGRHAEALPYHQRAARLDPGNVSAHLDASFSLFSLGRYEEALEEATVTAGLTPKDPAAHARIGVCLSGMGRHVEAITASRKAIELAPNRVDLYRLMISELYELGRYEDILEWCGRAVKADPLDPRLHFSASLSLRELGRYEEALPHCQKSIDLDPSNPDFRAFMSYLLGDLGRPSEALPYCKAVASAEPDNLYAHSHMGSMLAELGRHKEALDCFDKALRIDPEQPIPRYNRALSLQMTGRPHKALEEYERAVGLDPGNTRAYNNMGTVLTDLGKDGEAIAHFDRAIELDPCNAAAHLNKGISLWRLNLHKEALAHFDRAFELNPGSAEAYVGKLSCLDGLGLPDRKIGHYAGEALGPVGPGRKRGPGTAGRHAADASAEPANRPPAPSAPRAAPGGERAALVESLLGRSESPILEYKSRDFLNSEGSHRSRTVAVKLAIELCSFANTRGGDLLIGVGNDGKAEGLGSGDGRLSHEEKDSILTRVADVIVDYFGAENDGLFDYDIVEAGGLDILHCNVSRSACRPALLEKEVDGKHIFFVRVGSTCRALPPKKMLEYVRREWFEQPLRPVPNRAAGVPVPPKSRGTDLGYWEHESVDPNARASGGLPGGPL